MNRFLLTLALVVAGDALLLAAEVAEKPAEANRQAADETAIKQAVEAYVATYNTADAKALAAMWAPNAVYTNPDSDEQVVGRDAIEKQFAGIFAAAKGAKLTTTSTAIQFVSPNVAVEQGSAAIMRPDQSPEVSEYTAVYVKQEGKWLLDRVTEKETPIVTSNYEQLKSLDWMIGNWVDQNDQSKIETTCAWTKNQNFMMRSFAISTRDQVDMAGMQIVGWDPVAKRIRSWVFDSDGGFGEGVWSNKGNRWFIQAAGTTTDGKRVSAVNIITRVDDNTFTWQSVDRFADGELLPNVDEIAVVRQSSAE